MANKDTQANRAKLWAKRIYQADKAFQEWETKYKCADLEDFYLGHQHKGTVYDQDRGLGEEKYTINLCFPSIEIKLPSLLFYRPKVNIDVRPPFNDQKSDIVERTRLLEDTAQTFISDARVDFQNQTRLALKEAFYRFGVVEVGYSNDFIDNPNAGRPVLNEEGKPELDSETGQPLTQPAKIPNKNNKDHERIWVRRIPAHQFRVSIRGNNRLEWCDWCGYYTWEYLDDIKRNKNYKNTDAVKAGGAWSQRYEPSGKPERSSMAGDQAEAELHRGMVKLWKIWDIRTQTRIVIAEGSQKPLLEEKYKFLPFSVLRFHDIMDEFYPLPPMFNWRSPQVELNETREMQKIHRKRFTRRYVYVDGVIDEADMRKLEDGGDGVYAKAARLDCIAPVPDAPLDPSVTRNIPLTKDDFLQITGVTGEQRGVAESETATQANILDVRSRIRESFGRVQVGTWLGEIIRLILWTVRENMALSFWVKRNVDLQAQDAISETLRVQNLWKEIDAEDLEDMNYEVSVDVESLSPANEDTQRQQWLAWTQTLTPIKIMLLTTSEELLRKDLGFFGIRGDKQLTEIRKALQVILLSIGGVNPIQAEGMVKGGGGAPGLQPGPMGQPMGASPMLAAPGPGNAPGGPPVGDIMTQLMNQPVQAR